MSKISGGFLCGSLRYTSSAEPVMVAICHCTDCQKQSGSAFSVNVGVPEASIKLTGDTARGYAVTGTSSQAVTRYFCTTCGGPTHTVPEAFQGLAVIKAGTLDDSSWVKPGVQIWCDSAQPWGVISDEIQKTPGNPG